MMRERANIISGMDDFKRCLERSEAKGKWQAWRGTYFEKYRDIFASMNKYLYGCEVEDLEPVVTAFDFKEAHENAQVFFQDGGEEIVRRALEKSEGACPIKVPYDVYLLVGLGRIDGTSLPGKKLFLYFGLELYHSPAHLKVLVSHEYNHLVRLAAVVRKTGLDPSQFTIGQLVIFEGLGTLFPVVLYGKEISPFSIVEGGMMPREATAYCLQHEEELFEEVEEVWDQPLTPEMMEKYFSAEYGGWKGSRPEKIAYYVGSRIIGDLLREGQAICDLTKMPAEKIVERWNQMRAD